jgi:hypothetical protein
MSNENLIQGRVKDPEVMAFWKQMRRSYEPGVLVEMAIKALMGLPIQDNPYADLQEIIYTTVQQAVAATLSQMPQTNAYYNVEPTIVYSEEMVDFSDIDDDPMMGEL